MGCQKAGSAFQMIIVELSRGGNIRKWGRDGATAWQVIMSFCEYFSSGRAVAERNTSTLVLSAVDVMTESSQSAAGNQNPSVLLRMHRNEVIRTASEGNPCCVLQPHVAQFYL